MEKRDTSSDPTNPHLRPSPGTKHLTLRQALHYSGDAEEVAEMLQLKEAGFSGPIMMFFVDRPETEYERKVGRYERLHQNAEDSLRSKLVSGEIAATGRDSRDRIDSPRVAVPAELWQTLEFDFDNSSASGHGLLITHILVSVVGGLRLWKAVNAGVKMHRLAGVKMPHGWQHEGPPRGAFMHFWFAPRAVSRAGR